MVIDAAVVQEQGVEFTVVVVKPWLLNAPAERESLRQYLARCFDGRPTVLMAQDHNGVPTYDGRRDIVNFLANIWAKQLPWRRFSLN